MGVFTPWSVLFDPQNAPYGIGRMNLERRRGSVSSPLWNYAYCRPNNYGMLATKTPSLCVVF